MTASDLIDGNSSFIGRPNAYLPGAKETRREATITYSDFNNPEATKVRYSSFNYALSNYKDLNEEFGGIDYMMNESGDVLVIQNERVSMVPRDKTLFSDVAGESTVVASTNVLGTAKTFGLRAGCDGNPESVAVTPENAVFFAHKTLGKIYKYQPGSGVTTISDKNMAAFFRSAFQSALATSTEPGYTDIRIPGGYDPLTKEYLITIKDLGDDIIDGEEYDPDAEDVYGCTDPSSLNYNPSATIDDGSCEYEIVDEECLTVKFDYDPSEFNYGIQQLTEEEIDEDGTPLTEYVSTVVATNVGEDTATITGVTLYDIDHLEDFSFAEDLVGAQVEPEASVDINLLWNPSSLYNIDSQAQVKLDYVNQDGCSARTEFIPISGRLIGPTAPPPEAPRYLKVYVDGDNSNLPPLSNGREFTHNGRYGIQYDNHVQAGEFPGVGQVLENDVKFHSDPNEKTISLRIMVESSGLTSEDGAAVNLQAYPDGLLYETYTGQSTPDMDPDYLIVHLSPPEQTSDQWLLNDLQDDLGFSLGPVEVGVITITDSSLSSGSISLPGADTWQQGLETNQEWIDDPNTSFGEGGYLSLNGQDLVYTVGSTGVFGVQIPSDVGTNLSSSNGTQEYTFQIDQKYVASPIYAGTDFGWVRNSPAMVRQYCEIPSCATTYDQNGPTGTPVVGSWTAPLYQGYTDYTVNQPNFSGAQHPNLLSSAQAPFKLNQQWYSSDPNTFPTSDIMASMQIGKDCGGVLGCTNPSACNYNDEATVDDGSCFFPEAGVDCDGNPTDQKEGCTDPNADNYDPAAEVDNGSCQYSGCTNPDATNYDPKANVDDGSCVIEGCLDPIASNYNPLANKDDGSCEYECTPSYPCSLDNNFSGVVTQDEAREAFLIALDDYYSAIVTVTTINEIEKETIFETFRSKYPAFAGCEDDAIIAFFDSNGDGELSTADLLGFLLQTIWPYDCGTISYGQNICNLLNSDGEVTLEQINNVFTGASGPDTSGSITYNTGIDFDGDGVVTTIDYYVAIELIGLTAESDFFKECERPDDDDEVAEAGLFTGVLTRTLETSTRSPR